MWLAGGYDLETGHFFEVDSMVVTWWIVAFLHSDREHEFPCTSFQIARHKYIHVHDFSPTSLYIFHYHVGSRVAKARFTVYMSHEYPHNGSPFCISENTSHANEGESL